MKYTMPGLDSAGTLQRFCTMAEPERLESDTPVPTSGAYEGGLIGYWYWFIAGRLFVASFAVSLKDSREQREQKEQKAWRGLLTYVDGLLPARLGKDEGLSETVSQVADGGLFPTPG